MKHSMRFVRTISIFCLFFVVVIGTPEAQKTRKRPVTKRPVVKTTTPVQPAAEPAYTPGNVIEHGYVAGYNEGYLSGKSDYNANTPKDFQRSTIYQDANRGYDKQFGELAEYQRGFKAGYEIGYNDGYIGRDKNEKMPANLNTKPPTVAENPSMAPVRSRTPNKPRFAIAPDTAVKIRLETPISTKTNQEGDKFTAFVVEPQEYEGAVVEGHIAKLKRSGKLTGQTELALEFDRITFKDGTTSDFRAQVERVYATEKVKTIDDEGNVQSGDTTKDTTIRSAGGAAIGAIIGAIGGGGKGAAIGAILGATVGAGSVFIQGKDLQFDQGTEIQVRTLGPKK
ncbi:MAG: hypothetical protein JST84_27545 [Acidobacteria bacterium]|nr:hypothetical protein [Acidobacteriota bacterium]